MSKIFTKQDILLAVSKIRVISETVEDFKQVPSGHLYAMVMTHYSLEEYMFCIDFLKQQKIIKEENHLLTWIGLPEKELQEVNSMTQDEIKQAAETVVNDCLKIVNRKNN